MKIDGDSLAQANNFLNSCITAWGPQCVGWVLILIIIAGFVLAGFIFYLRHRQSKGIIEALTSRINSAERQLGKYQILDIAQRKGMSIEKAEKFWSSNIGEKK